MAVEEMSDQQLPFDPSKLPTEVLLCIASWLDRMNDRTRTETRMIFEIRAVLRWRYKTKCWKFMRQSIHWSQWLHEREQRTNESEHVGPF